MKELEPKQVPLVGVIIPLYNKGKYIARAIDSVLGQTYQNFEIIVVNDGSTDNSPDIVSNYPDSRIHIIHQMNSGPGAARNRGITESKAPFLSFLDADDEWLPEFLEKSIEHLQKHPECLLSVSGHFRGEERTSWQEHLPHFLTTEGVWRLPTDMKPQLVKSAIDFFHSGAVLCSRQIVEQFGGFYSKDRCTYGEDSYLWIQAALNYQIYLDPTPLMWHHTEASELGQGRKGVRPPWPKLTDPEPIRNNCPPEYRSLLEHCLAYYALLAAYRHVYVGDTQTVKALLESFPMSKTFYPNYIKLKIRLTFIELFNKFWKLRTWLNQTKIAS
ncbi:glycosyltransferase family 2 protein [Nostoc sp. FACHB-280]|uniref:glycosyltransferase family 2 protein n=1 Tax=Nostoc sp. FACHB-280 TaxID=2692839 RepID=UPI00168A9D47|nr:glycosyltransferase family 2 protein [Nostoc sp. FACHB-280]MBD2494040.1 glycosyltransferase family 2 protein [Nostoc sp. FACHB-280]